MKWPALVVQFSPSRSSDPPDLRDRLSVALDGLGVTAIQEDDDGWRVFFASGADRDRALAHLAASFPALSPAPTEVEDEDWAARSQANLKAVRVGSVLIAPPWDAGEVSSARPGPGTGATLAQSATVTIVIQPSMGFGTGHHASTRICLRLLQRLDLRNQEVLDIGTGSGVLALAAHRLGARHVRGIDTDPDAIRAARENVALNRITAGIDLSVADFRTPGPAPVPLVVANLTGGLVARHAAALLRHVAVPGHLILSGVTTSEEDEVISALGKAVTVRGREVEEEWVGLLVERR